MIVGFKSSIFGITRGVFTTANEGKSAASFCCQVAAGFPDIFYNFYMVKHHKIAKYSMTTTKAREKKYRFGILRILGIF
jgi:hypothetical protein